MGKLHRVMCVAALLAAGCAEKRVRDPDAIPAPRGRVSARAEAGVVQADTRFDAHGKLKPSGLRFSWLELPAGFSQRPGATETTGVWEARDIPLDKVTEFLEARLSPSSMELRPNGVVYRQAKASHTQLPLPPIGATALEIDPVAHVVRLVLDDLTPPREAPLPDKLAERELARERNRME